MCLIVGFCDEVRADRAQRLSESAFSQFLARFGGGLFGWVRAGRATVWHFLRDFLQSYNLVVGIKK